MKYSIGIFLLILTGCVNKTSSEDSPKIIMDPNPTSEMAQQMREMTKELEAIKIKLEKNEALGKNLLNFELIHHQQVTDSSFNKPHIEPMSIAFHYAVGEFNKEPSYLALLSYDLVGLIYYLSFKNDFNNPGTIFKKKNSFKGKIGIFDIQDNKINHRLNFFKIENNKLKEIF